MKPIPISEVKTFYSTIQDFHPGIGIPIFIIEGEELFPDAEFWKSVDPAIRIYALDKSHSSESLSDTIVEAQELKQPVVVEVKADPDPAVITILSQISSEDSFNLLGLDGRQKQIIKLTSPVMVVMQRKFLETGISYPNFWSFFGPGLSLNQ